MNTEIVKATRIENTTLRKQNLLSINPSDEIIGDEVIVQLNFALTSTEEDAEASCLFPIRLKNINGADVKAARLYWNAEPFEDRVGLENPRILQYNVPEELLRPVNVYDLYLCADIDANEWIKITGLVYID